MKKQLAAILYADVAGYSRLTAGDEDKTHRKLDASLNLLSDVIPAHGGRKIHEAGDAILAEFQSVTEAVTAAVKFQRQMSKQNAKLAENERFEFRLGVNLGEVIHDRDDIYGDGVNLAARIQELAEPGSICISGAVYEQVFGKVDVIFDDLGYRTVKNIAQSVHVYRVRFPDSDLPSSTIHGSFFGTSGKSSPLIIGGCLCGEVRYEISAPATETNYCHCRMCKKFAGAPVAAGVTFPRDAFRQASTRKLTYYQSSLVAERGFCANCESSITYRGLLPTWSDWILVYTASLDNPEDFAPTGHWGVESQMPWYDVHDDLPRICYEDDPDMVSAWESVGVSSSDAPRNVSVSKKN
jgi:class 3 adenylate cyclase